MLRRLVPNPVRLPKDVYFGEVTGVHEIACPDEHTIYVAELLNWRLQRLLLK